MEKCCVCKKQTVSTYMVRHRLFSRIYLGCRSRGEEEGKASKRRHGSLGLGTWIILVLGLAIGALWYFKIELPFGDKVKGFAAQYLGWGSEPEGSAEGGASGRVGNASLAATNNAPAAVTESANGSVTLNLRSDVLFEFGSAALKSTAGGSLQEVAKVIRQRPQSKVVIRGYTDSIGTPQANLTLSRQRAESVRDWMASSGISAKQLSVMGMGSKDPVAANAKADGSDNPAGREQNRRVTVSVSAL